MKKKIFIMILSCALLAALAVALPAASVFAKDLDVGVSITASSVEVFVGDTVDFTVTAFTNENGKEDAVLVIVGEAYDIVFDNNNQIIIKTFSVTFDEAGEFIFEVRLVAGKAGTGNYGFGEDEITIVVKALEEEDKLESAAASAWVIKDKGNTNTLTVIVTETYESGKTVDITGVFIINNNAIGTYKVGAYKVYVDTKGNVQVRECYIVE